MDVRNLSIKLRHWGGVVVLLSLILGCSVHDFVPVWRYCGVTITDSEDNTAVIYEGCGTSVFNIDLDSTEAYSLSIVRTDDSAPIDGDGISFICDGVDILNNHSSGGISVAKDGNTYTFSGIPNTEKTVEIILMLDDIVIGTHIVNIRKDRYISDSVDPPAEPIEIELSFDAEADDPEFITILPSKSIKGLEIYYTLDGSEPSSASSQYSGPLNIGNVSGDKTLKAKAFTCTSESEVAVLNYIIKDSTYIIYSEDGLRTWASSMPSNEVGGVPGILGKDIALTSADENSSNWTPIYEYNGTFDGRNHTISGLTVKNAYFAAFFEVLNGNVKNLKLTDVDIEGSVYAGGIAGVLDGGRISGCAVSGTVSGGDYAFAGGIAGEIGGGSISECSVSGTISGMDYCYAGGIAGYAEGVSISDSESSATVSGDEAGGIIGAGNKVSISGCTVAGRITGNSSAGGIAGNASGMDIDGCTNNAEISGGNRIGSIAGVSQNSTSIKNCMNNGVVSGVSHIGGIVGHDSSSQIESCENNGEIKGTGSNVGGIVGNTTNDPGTEIIDCINNASVSGTERVGGICGRLTNESSIVGCRNEGDGTISGNSNVGGIAGYISSSEIMYCYNKMSVSASENAGGIAGGSASRLSSNIEGCYNTSDITAPNLGGGIIGDADPSDSFSACYSTGSAYYGIGGPVGWNDPTFIACYWSGSDGGGGGAAISGINHVDSWTEDIMNSLNGAITSSSQYQYVISDFGSNEPYKLEKREATT